MKALKESKALASRAASSLITETNNDLMIHSLRSVYKSRLCGKPSEDDKPLQSKCICMFHLTIDPKSQRGLRKSRPHVRKWERLQTVANHSGWSKHWAEARELKNQEAKNWDIIQERVYLIHKHSLGINLSWTVNFYTEVFVERADSHTGQTRVSNKKKSYWLH